MPSIRGSHFERRPSREDRFEVFYNKKAFNGEAFVEGTSF